MNKPVALTRREREILDKLALGLSNKEIADALNLTPGTVKTYLGRIRQKDPEHANRYQAVKWHFRDHQRLQAIKLNNWIQQWSGALPAEALTQIRALLAEQVSEVLAAPFASPKEKHP